LRSRTGTPRASGTGFKTSRDARCLRSASTHLACRRGRSAPRSREGNW
jgi:hypothetical protein